jgi:hypothetical protein
MTSSSIIYVWEEERHRQVKIISRIIILISKNLNEIKTKFLKGKFTPKCEFFLLD